jgi:hypothetical protein
MVGERCNAALGGNRKGDGRKTLSHSYPNPSNFFTVLRGFLVPKPRISLRQRWPTTCYRSGLGWDEAQ